MRERLACLGIPLDWPLYREDHHDLIAELAMNVPGRAGLQCSVAEILEMNMGLFFDLIERQRDARAREAKR